MRPGRNGRLWPAGRLSAMVWVCVLACGCASSTAQMAASTPVPYDPFERYNRTMFAANRAVDKYTLKPLAKGYKKIMPTPVRRGFANIFSNFTTPRSALNNFLQGKPKRGFSELGRFLFNTTLGLGGIFDVAGAGGMSRYDESFSQTLAVWGLPEGPYLVLPFFGPSSTLDAAALPVDFYTDINPYLRASVKDKLYLFRTLDARARLLTAEDALIDKSTDPYISLRETYWQNRQFQIYDGNPPTEEAPVDQELLDEYYNEN
jgi:phospholipid-binding lipoprotein MlaA